MPKYGVTLKPIPNMRDVPHHAMSESGPPRTVSPMIHLMQTNEDDISCILDPSEGINKLARNFSVADQDLKFPTGVKSYIE